MKHAVSQELLSYWNELRGLRMAPERGDLDPAALRRILGDVFILELDEENRFRFRITGARTSALFLKDLKGSPFASLWNPASLSGLGDLVLSVPEESRPAIAGVTAAPSGRPYLDLELLLPLRHLGQTHTRLLGALSPAAVPGWLGLVACEPLNLGPMRLIRTSAGTSFAASSPVVNPSVRRSHLRVHDGGLGSGG